MTPKSARLLSLFALVFSSITATAAEPLFIENASTRIEIAGTGPESVETILMKQNGQWVPALSAKSSSVRITIAGAAKPCVLATVVKIEHGLMLRGNCFIGSYEQRIQFTADSDVLQVYTSASFPKKFLDTFVPPGITAANMPNGVEDRYSFLPEKHPMKDPLDSPLDFVWSQNIKREVNDVVANEQFKSPAVMMQQGEVFAAITPTLDERLVRSQALDLDVTSDAHPWMSYGIAMTEPHGHSYYHRVFDEEPLTTAHLELYAYTITLSRQPEKLGYRRAVRDLWSEYGHPTLVENPDIQKNVFRKELSSFDSWRYEAWHTYADSIYVGFDCNGKRCGTLSTKRDIHSGGGGDGADAWFNAWFQTLRTGYGWYINGRATHDTEMMAKADSILTLSLTAPQNEGAFPTVYFLKNNTWQNDDGWAGYAEDYHAFCMSWQAYWMLRWVNDLEPQRKPEVMKFLKPYADFLVKHQLASGVIPSWYDKKLVPRADFRDFNAETGASALFLVAFAQASGDSKYIATADRAMTFTTEEVVPRQKWFDFETFLSCAKKPYDFYDKWTAQFPQNNLAEIQSVQAWLALYQSTHKPIYLERGKAALDYLLLTQQVWDNPLYTPKLLGGFTTQNTDTEWSDARQAYGATLLFDYFRETGDFEYLERAVAAARSGFAVAPWENWAHNGHPDGGGAMTGFHWGTGSAMTSVEMMQPTLGDAYIDVKAGKGVGFDECSLMDVHVDGEKISFQLKSLDRLKTFSVHFAGVEAGKQYSVSWNGGAAQKISGRDLLNKGVQVANL